LAVGGAEGITGTVEGERGFEGDATAGWGGCAGDALGGKAVATVMVVVLGLVMVTANIELVVAIVLMVVPELTLGLMPSTSRHCEYQGFCSTQVQPAEHVVPPVHLIPVL
jgi:hypothetical protein